MHEEAPKAFDDVKLVDCAIATDSLVLSLDCSHRTDIARSCCDVPGVADVVWACPEHHEGVVDWLAAGPSHKAEWTLGRAETTEGQQ